MAVSKGSFKLIGEKSCVLIDPKEAKKQTASSKAYSLHNEAVDLSKLNAEHVAAALDEAARSVKAVKAGMVALRSAASSSSRRAVAADAVYEQLRKLNTALELISWKPSYDVSYADLSQDVKINLPIGVSNVKLTNRTTKRSNR